MPICNNCGYEGGGTYCAECGKPYEIKRLTFASLLHEVAHVFTHLDKGFGYTLKQLATRPGQMQKDYLTGKRDLHQKPFSMFFICATITGLAIYWIGKSNVKTLQTPFQEMRLHFYQHYYIILQSVLIPYYAFVLWLLFRKKNFNYAECLVMFVYAFAFLLLLVAVTNTIGLVSPSFKIYYAEIPLLAIYVVWTNLNFFKEQPSWLVIMKSIASILICWFTSRLITDQIIRWML